MPISTYTLPGETSKHAFILLSYIPKRSDVMMLLGEKIGFDMDKCERRESSSCRGYRKLVAGV